MPYHVGNSGWHHRPYGGHSGGYVCYLPRRAPFGTCYSPSLPLFWSRPRPFIVLQSPIYSRPVVSSPVRVEPSSRRIAAIKTAQVTTIIARMAATVLGAVLIPVTCGRALVKRLVACCHR